MPREVQSYFPTHDDAELEWLLCSASAIQAREKQKVESVAERQPSRNSPVLDRLQTLLKGLGRAERIRAA